MSRPKTDQTKVLVIPDPQIRKGVRISHMAWAARYANDKRPGTIICLGDLHDFPSLSRWDRGKKAMEGRRVWKDLEAARDGVTAFEEALEYKPRKIILEGNHENRLDRAVEENSTLAGLLERSFSSVGIPLHPKAMMRYYGWTVIPFLRPFRHRGVVYAHYFANPRSGRPIGGTAHNLLNKIGETFVQGHRQELDIAVRDTPSGRRIRGLIAGAFYQHKEPYAGPQGNNHWRGIVLLTEVQGGWYNLVEVSMEYLRRRYS
jgi:hypothetical protein